MRRVKRLIGTAMLASFTWVGIVVTPSAALTLEELCDAKGPVLVTATLTELFTGPEVLNHLPGPAARDFGDKRIGTADDGIHPGLTLPPDPDFSPIFGCPNDLAGGSAVPGITCGVPGSPGTRPLHGTTTINSQESSLHGEGSDNLSLSVPGHGAYSFLIATVGQFQSLSYLTGAIVAALTGFDGTAALLQVANVTLGGTTLVPNVFFSGPFNADLISVGPGDDIKWKGIRDDDRGETIVRGCNGLARGVDGLDPRGNPIDWQPVSPGPFPKFPNIKRTNSGRWDLRSDPEKGGRLVNTTADNLTKVPTSAGFFVTQDVVINGYLFPLDEAEALLFKVFRPNAPDLNDLPDIPGFPGSGENLAKYFVEVLVPKAFQNPDNRLVGFFRGQTTVEIVGQETFLDIVIAGAGNFIDFDLCSMDVRPCTF